MPRGGLARRSRRVTATPARSLPWMAPTTRITRFALGDPIRSAVIGRPSADLPTGSVLAPVAAGAISSAAIASEARVTGAKGRFSA